MLCHLLLSMKLWHHMRWFHFCGVPYSLKPNFQPQNRTPNSTPQWCLQHILIKLTYQLQPLQGCILTVLIQYLHSGQTYWLSGDLGIARNGNNGNREGLILLSNGIIQYCDQHRHTGHVRIKCQGLSGRSEVLICCGTGASTYMAGSNGGQWCAELFPYLWQNQQ